jgi:tRNA(Ile)-lysidine synthase
MAQLARDEEAFWQAELARLEPQMLRPVRVGEGGGGRAAGDGLSLDVNRLAALPRAFQRRLLRSVAEQLGAAVDFPSTEALRNLALTGRAGQKLQLAKGLRVERTAREMRLIVLPEAPVGKEAAQPAPEYTVAIPGEVVAPAFGLRLRIEVDELGKSIEARTATLRNWEPGDRVRLRHSSTSRKVKEVLERLKVTGSSRSLWPVLELDGRIIWMQGVEVEPVPEIHIIFASLEASAEPAP